jgi:hypothetical protein
MFVCVYFFAVSPKNVEAGPLSNFLNNFSHFLISPNKDSLRIIEDGEDASLSAKRAVYKPSIYYAALELLSSYNHSLAIGVIFSHIPQHLVDSIISCMREEYTESGQSIIRFEFFTPQERDTGWTSFDGYIGADDHAFFRS